MRGNKTRGFICGECDVLNIDTEVCLSCGQPRDYHFVKPNLYIYKGKIRSAKEWAYELDINVETIYRSHKRQKPKFRLLYKTRE